MAIPVIENIGPIDTNAYTGPTRVMSGVARMGAVVLDTPYGATGVPEFARWLYVGVTGNVSLQCWDGTTISLLGLAAGVWHPIYSSLIHSSGTTATNMVWGS